MQSILIDKITLNMGIGNSGEILDKALVLLEEISGAKPIKTVSKKRIPTWGIRPGLPIGCKVTLRGEKTEKLLRRLLQAVNNNLNKSQFDEYGNFSFGIKEYIDIPEVKYHVEIGIIGLEVSVTMKKPGLRVKIRKIKRNNIPRKQMPSQEEVIKYMQEKFGVTVE